MAPFTVAAAPRPTCALLLALAAAPLAGAARRVHHGSLDAHAGSASRGGELDAGGAPNISDYLSSNIPDYLSRASDAVRSMMPSVDVFRQPSSGACAFHDVDNFRPPTDDKCYIRVYRCTDGKKPQLENHNVGDVGWALSGECHGFGGLLHIYQIEVARAWMFEQPCWDDGVLNLCKGGYTMCNRGDYGSVCGCGTSGNDCGPDPRKKRTDANNFGWRTVPDIFNPHLPVMGKDLSTCPCSHYSLPTRARGSVDGAKTRRFLQERQYEDRSIDAKFQWQQVGGATVVKVDSCIDKHVLKAGTTLEEKLAAFQSAVLEGKEPDCRR